MFIKFNLYLGKKRYVFYFYIYIIVEELIQNFLKIIYFMKCKNDEINISGDYLVSF